MKEMMIVVLALTLAAPAAADCKPETKIAGPAIGVALGPPMFYTGLGMSIIGSKPQTRSDRALLGTGVALFGTGVATLIYSSVRLRQKAKQRRAERRRCRSLNMQNR